MSNLKTIQLATIMYANDNQQWVIFCSWQSPGQNGVLGSNPPLSPVDYGYNTTSQNSVTARPRPIQPSSENNTDPGVPQAQFSGGAMVTNPNWGSRQSPYQIYGNVSKRFGVWRCPEDTREENSSNPYGWPASYTLNNKVFAQIKISAGSGLNWTPITGFETMFKMNAIASTSRMMGFIESTSGNGFDPGVTSYTPSSGPYTAVLQCQPVLETITVKVPTAPREPPPSAANFAIFHPPKQRSMQASWTGTLRH